MHVRQVLVLTALSAVSVTLCSGYGGVKKLWNNAVRQAFLRSVFDGAQNELGESYAEGVEGSDVEESSGRTYVMDRGVDEGFVKRSKREVEGECRKRHRKHLNDLLDDGKLMDEEMRKEHSAIGSFRFERENPRRRRLERMRRKMFRMFDAEEEQPSRRKGGTVRPIKGLRKDVGFDGDYEAEEVTQRPKAKQEVTSTPRTPKATRRGKGPDHLHRSEPRIKNYTETKPPELEVENSYSVGNENGDNGVKCKTVAKLNSDGTEDRTVNSKGTSFSQQGANDQKSLICRGEAADTVRPNQDVTLKHRVSGGTVITQENNPQEFLDENYQPDEEVLEIGSSSYSRLDSSSSKNTSTSIIDAHDRKAESMSHTRSKLKYEGDSDKPTGMESVADIEGNTAFDSSNRKPIIMTSKHEESGMIVQNPNENLEKPIHNDDVKSYMDYQKKSDFEIMFRSLGFEEFTPPQRMPRIEESRPVYGTWQQPILMDEW